MPVASCVTTNHVPAAAAVITLNVPPIRLPVTFKSSPFFRTSTNASAMAMSVGSAASASWRFQESAAIFSVIRLSSYFFACRALSVVCLPTA